MKPRSSPRSRNSIADNLIEVQSGLHAVRSLRAGLLDLASRLAESDPDRTALLILVDPLITDQRLEEEWGTAERILRPELLGRLGVVISRKGRLKGFPRDPDPAMQAVVDRAIKDTARPGGTRLPRMETFPEILKVLVNQWMTGRGPMTADWLARAVGCNYRTVARALDRLRPSLDRRSDRRIELREFPREEWARLVALGDRARITIRYIDTSGQPRSPQFLLARLEKMGRSDIGVGGALGAAHYYPKLDVTGLARLDLSIHCPNDSVDLAIVGRLDPALKRSDDPAMPATVVLHVVRRRESLFDVDKSGLRWADPAECLLDLHEVRLESQARQLVEFFEARRLES